jgi:EPSP synthase (3-phosphoshikimate 1-carboxyvinyltransferase)
VRLPPSGDLFFTSIIIALAAKTAARISPLADIPLVPWWEKAFAGHAVFTCDAGICTVAPVQDSNAAPITLSYDEIPYRDFTVFSLLGLGKTMVVDPLPPARLDAWTKLAADCGCNLQTAGTNGKTTMHLDGSENFRVRDTVKNIDGAHPILGLALGLGKEVSLIIDAAFASPLRHVLPAFGYKLTVASSLRDKNEDPLVRRMRFMQTGKKSEGPVTFTVAADFSKREAMQPDITVPGDDVLGAIFAVAKCIVPRGSLIIENAGLESWNTATLALFKKMGGVIATQETGETSFGSCGTVSITKSGHCGRKVDCEPLFHYVPQLPAMVVLAAFGDGQTVFRGLADLRSDEPDGIAQILSCVKLLGARHGEMPDGLVVDGGRQFDGFDLSEHMPAHIAASFAAAGLRCMGKTKINDEAIVRRWPRFKEMLESICEFRE